MKKGEKKKTTKRAITPPVKTNGIDTLIDTAIKSKASVDNLKELMAMKYEHEARENKKEFHDNFCELQCELPIIEKTKDVLTKHGKKIYSYAPLEKIVEQIKPYLKKYHFSYHWSESMEREGYKRIYCHITGYGHSESAYTDIPIMQGNAMTNSIQQNGSAITYGKRYSLMGILGIMADEDVDGQTPPPPPKPVPPKQDKPIEVLKNVTPKHEQTKEEVELKQQIITAVKDVLGLDGVGFKKKFGIGDMSVLKMKELKDLMSKVNAEIDKGGK